MRAVPGAFEHVKFDDGDVVVSTIANEPPIGICGSGILDSIAEMKKYGIIDNRVAIQALLSIDCRKKIQDVINNVESVELTTYSDFQKEYLRALYF